MERPLHEAILDCSVSGQAWLGARRAVEYLTPERGGNFWEMARMASWRDFAFFTSGAQSW